MGPERYLIDSNSAIDYLGGKLSTPGMIFMPGVVNAGPVVSVITKIEVLGYSAPPEDASLLREFMSTASVLGLSEAVVDETIDIRKAHRIKTPDAVIAATARLLGLTLITRNTSDFKQINGLKLVNPYEIS